MTFYRISAIVATLFFLGLAFLIVKKSQKTPLYRACLMLCGSLVLWNAATFAKSFYSSLLLSDTIRNPLLLCENLRTNASPLCSFLLERMTPQTREMVASFKGPEDFGSQVKGALAADLNEIIKTEFLFNEKLFDLQRTREKTRDLFAAKPRGAALVMANRLLLEDAFPEIEKRPAGSVRFWLQLLHLGVIFLPVTLFHLSSIIARFHRPWVLRTFYIIHFAFVVILVNPLWPHLYIDTIQETLFGPVVGGGKAFKLFFVHHSLLSLFTIGMLYRQLKSASKLHARRLLGLLIATVSLALFGSHDYLLVAGMVEYPLTSIRIVPLGNLAALFFGVSVGYSTLQHQLLDIHITFSRLAAQLVRLLFVFFTAFLLLLLLTQLLPKQFPPLVFVSSLAVFLVSLVVATQFFPRLLGKGEEKLERRLLGDWFEYQEKINGFIESIPLYTQKEPLLDALHDLLVSTVRVKHYHVILLDEPRHAFSLVRSHPVNHKALLPELDVESPIFKVFETVKTDYFAMKAAYVLPGDNPVENSAREQFEKFGSEFAFPFLSDKDPFGLLLIGEKETGEIYTRYDLNLFVQMLRHLSLVLSQIRLKNRLLQSEQMELLGTMSRGIAHDMNNLLTPVSTYLQLARDGDVDASVNQDLLPMALRNVETMRAYIHEALFFSKTQSLQLKKVRFEQLIHNVVDMVQSGLKRKNIRLDIQVSGLLEAVIDEILIQRLAGNLISNAIDASRPGAQIYVSVVRLGKMQSGCDWYRLRVIDEGEGISRENLKKVATPYFTTKDRGDSGRGFGLGLAICRKIVHLHRGNMTITSELHKGTMVQVDIPDRLEAVSAESKPFKSMQVVSAMADVA